MLSSSPFPSEISARSTRSRLQAQRYSTGSLSRIFTSKSERTVRSMCSGSGSRSSMAETFPAAMTPPSTLAMVSSPAPGMSWMR